MKLDDWQEKLLKTKGDIVLRSGRQVGKSTIVAIKAAEFAVKNPRKKILIIAATERQSYLLFEKTLQYLVQKYNNWIMKGKFRPTKHIINLKNKSQILSYPTGIAGYGIRGYTVDLLIADEAAFIPEDVWTAVTPMLATTKGNIILLSTPHGKSGFYYECFNDPRFTSFHISSEDCPRISKEWLAREKQRMTKVQYAQEYLGEFIDEVTQFFPSDLIKECMVLDKETDSVGNYFLGVDFAGYGGDENAFVVIKKIKDRIEVVEILTTTGEEIKNNITGDTIDKIILLDRFYKFKKIYVDDGGLGSPIYDFLREVDDIKRRVVALNNARRSIDYNSDRGKRLLKTDLYANLLRLMEQKKIKLLKDERLALSLKSIQWEIIDGNYRIYGRYSHITEGLIRACWCVKEKSLNIYVY